MKYFHLNNQKRKYKIISVEKTVRYAFQRRIKGPKMGINKV